MVDENKSLSFIQFFSETLYTIYQFIEQNAAFIMNLIGILLLTFVLFYWKKKFVKYLLSKSTSSKSSLSPSQIDVIDKLFTVAIFLLAIFFLMDITGRNMQTLIAFGGIGGLALAFASQQVIANFFGGLMIYITHPFTIGEWISLPERKVEGYIEEIGWYMTLVRGFDKRPIYLPNSIFTQTIVVTPSRMSYDRFYHKFYLRYEDSDRLPKILEKVKKMLSEHPNIVKRIGIDVYFINILPSGLEIEISAYVDFFEGKARRISTFRQDVLLKIAGIVKEEGAEFFTPPSVIAAT